MAKKIKLKEFIHSMIRIFTHDIWAFESQDISNIRKKVFRFFKGCYLVFHGFIKNKCLLRASALTYTTILAIVPLLAVAFSILKGFGFQNTSTIRNVLLKFSGGKSAIADNIVQYINNTNVGTLGAIGVALLFFTVISLLGNIEKSFNVIWGIRKGRPFTRKITDYLSVTLIAPLLFIVAASATATLQSNVIIQKLLSISVLSYIYLFILKVLPYTMIWLVMTFLYSFLPNTNVKFTSALGGGIIGGTLWQIAQWGYISFQVGVAKYGAIYGSFAPLPLFLIWVYFSWVIVLLGAQISFAIQNLKTFQKEAGVLKVDNEKKQKLAVKILLLLSKNFEAGNEPLTNEDMANQLTIPVTLVNEVLYILEKYRIVIQVKKTGGQYFSLIKPPEKIYFPQIIKNLNQYAETDISVSLDKEYKYIESLFEKIDLMIQKSNINMNLKEILARIK
ncbi:MAG: YihY family inner membrane protein [Spirochaetes bacterium]|nr:YihY family inner membrane protein [Spirochaetota bacterium]